jgi:hypothetical protein
MAENINNEEQLQAHCFQWFWNEYPEERQMLFHPWQKSKDRAEGARAKAFGVVAGISDLILILPAGKVVFVELKYGKGTMSDHQVRFSVKVQARGHQHYVIYTFDGFKNLIKKLLY